MKVKKNPYTNNGRDDFEVTPEMQTEKHTSESSCLKTQEKC